MASSFVDGLHRLGETLLELTDSLTEVATLATCNQMWDAQYLMRDAAESVLSVAALIADHEENHGTWT